MRTLAALVLTALCALPACDVLEERLDGKAAPLKEADLPNCSRVLTCCANLGASSLTSGAVQDSCEALVPATDTVITQYQVGRQKIEQDQATSAETKAQLLAELRQTTQGTMEPACRCLLEETVGKVSANNFLSPIDCETVTSSGALPDGKQCSDVTDAVLNPPTE